MKQKQFPPQTGAYAVKVKSEQSTAPWQAFTVARAQISIGQDYHEGEKLAALSAWLAPRFESVDICVNDTLQRFSLMFDHDIARDAAFATALHDGDTWLARNGALFTAPHVNLIRWNRWLEDSRFADTHAKIATLYQSNTEFHHAIDGNIQSLWERRLRLYPGRYEPARFLHFAELSRQYLLEEISAFSLMYTDKTAIDVYPGTTIFAALVFQGRAVDGAPAGLGNGHFCRVDFSRNKILQPANIDIAPNDAARRT